MKREQEPGYWRSVERLWDSPALEPLAEGEFARGASSPPLETSRRQMLSLMGASFAFAGLAGCRRPVEEIVPFVNPPEGSVPGIPKQFATVHLRGTRAVGVVVESHEGRPSKVEGNRLHPASLGGADSWAQASVLELYDPDRSRRPVRRDESERFAGSSWDAFLEEWQPELKRFETAKGSGLAVVSGAWASPTLSRHRERFASRFPKAVWVVHEPFGESRLLEGSRRWAGVATRPVYRLDRAKTIVSLGSDFLLTDSPGPALSRGFAAGRKATSEMSRLYVVESSPTATGASADHRISISNSELPSLVAWLLGELVRLGLALPGVVPESPGEMNAVREKELHWLATDLMAAGPKGAVIVGFQQPPEVHAAAQAINQALGAIGETVVHYPVVDTQWEGTDDLATLAAKARAGEIEALVVLDANPLYSSSAELDLEGALRGVRLKVHSGLFQDETARLCDWHLPQSHWLESWGDARTDDGSASVVQPLIAPLHDSRSAVEILRLIALGKARPGYSDIRDHWRESVIGSSGFESSWNQTLHDGVLAESRHPPHELPPVLEDDRFNGALLVADLARLERTNGLELSVRPSPAVFDGRYANNAWLQELPDSITKLTWGNAARISPSLAAEKGLESGDEVRLSVGGRALDVPVVVQPGQASSVVTLDAGYGRSAAGRVGDGVGVTAFDLWSLEFGADLNRDVTLEATGRHVDLAGTQEHGSMEGRDLVRELLLGDVGAGETSKEKEEWTALWEPARRGAGPQWGMTIDLNTCTGCNACVIACQAENNIPVVGPEQVRLGREMHWLRIDRYYGGDPEHPSVSYQPVPCMHCEQAPCEEVCPVAATVHSDSGLNTMVYNRCVGTRYCSNNCPYKVRRFNFFNYTKDTPELLKMAMNPDVTVRSRGVMEKCTYCVQRINRAERDARLDSRALQDGDVKTACQETCPGDAIRFGDIEDPTSRVAESKRDARNYSLLEELDVRPRTTYLARVRNPHPLWETDA